ncbi:mannose-6-phosphate isomerase, class I [Vibrio tritonius]|uniref:mannose-6-phosphate isomerase, class I n=1 Tax=Vibrio tritonius TaxID=1435069 RepID=UPI000838BDA9|nr:mannose-6-phosphate isomerase, class I [Vibrio tritonius]
MSVSDFPSFLPMQNVIQHYAWGSKTAIANLFDIPNPNHLPQAEIWMGAHQNGCSTVKWHGETIKLSTLIEQSRQEILSEKTAQKYQELPFLFKVLAADKALSVQVHPDKKEAEIGYEKENLAKIPLDSPIRNYKDPNHKPELVYALSQYQAMNGFRSHIEIIELFQELASKTLVPLVEKFTKNQTEDGLKHFFISLLSLQGLEKKSAISELVSFSQSSDSSPFTLITDLKQHYPDDIGLFTPLFLNVITLEPGEAMYLDARTPHAYLKGTGLEVMANSDNVLRAGLTPKHIDVIELASCTAFKEKPFDTLKLEPTVHEFGEQKYAIPVNDFKFSLYPSPLQAVVKPQSAEIIMAIDEEVVLSHRSETFVLQKGQSVFIPAYVEQYTIQSQARVARVYN